MNDCISLALCAAAKAGDETRLGSVSEMHVEPAGFPVRQVRRQPRPSAARQGGVGLIEVLVAVLVVSVGFLGLAALQAKSLSTNNSAMARSMATIHSYSILDAMRADIASAKNNTYNKTVKASACPTDTSTLAGAQLNDWCTQLGNSLGKVDTTTGNVDCKATGVCIVTIAFDDSRAGVGGTSNQTITTKGML
ncbi:MAG: type IV pilus modification protein PilV [Rhodanobacter sp.]